MPPVTIRLHGPAKDWVQDIDMGGITRQTGLGRVRGSFAPSSEFFLSPALSPEIFNTFYLEDSDA